jgi:flagellar secretion chaperone FliS
MATPYGYAKAYQTQAVMTASPGQLVLMLYDGALRFLGHAIDLLKAPEETPRRIELSNTYLLKTQAILSELQANLNLEAGGDHAKNLYRLYDYHLRRLFEANLRKDPVPAVEVERLVRELRDAWAEMLRNQESERLSSARGVA